MSDKKQNCKSNDYGISCDSGKGNIKIIKYNAKRILEFLILSKTMCVLFSMLRRTRKSKKKIILFMAPFYTQERLNDGYYKRVQAVDQLMDESIFRVYASWIDADYQNRRLRFVIHDKNHIEISFPHPQRFCDFAVRLLADRVDYVYYHSITFAMRDISRKNNNKLIVDLHGAYPEEERMYERYEQADRDEKEEKIAVENAKIIICVSNEMQHHIQKKYPRSKAAVILLPIFDSLVNKDSSFVLKRTGKKPTVVYAGGMQKWQCPERMIEIIKRVKDKAEFRIFTPETDAFRSLWNNSQLPDNLRLETKTRKELGEEYLSCDYGFLLRENSVVNQVACPTKLIEYLENDIIPILDDEKVGDFVKMGMRYVTVKQLENAQFPPWDVYRLMIQENREVIRQLKQIQKDGMETLQSVIKK